MIRRPPKTTRTDPPFPDPTAVRSAEAVGDGEAAVVGQPPARRQDDARQQVGVQALHRIAADLLDGRGHRAGILVTPICGKGLGRSEEHTSELQSLMRISYAVFCLKKKN